MRKLIFSTTAKDCDFQAFKSSGPGGQHRNKVSTAIRCIHRLSGAVGVAGDDKSQHRNKRVAFGRMARSKKFQDWARLEASRRTGELAAIEKKVEKSLQDKHLRVEVHNDDGRWIIEEPL